MKANEWRAGSDKTLPFFIGLQPGKFPKARSTPFVCFLQHSNRQINK
jgi:hypothetical protein